MTKAAPAIVLISCMAALTGMLTACSAGVLPGGALPGGAVSAGSTPSASVAPADQGATRSGSKTTTSSESTSQTLSAVPKECPKTSQVASEVGLALKDPTFTHNSATLNCKYGTDSTDNMVQINFITAPKVETGGDIEAYIAHIAAGGDDTMTQVNGLGQAAYALSSPNDNGAAIQLLNNGIQLTLILFTGDLGSAERVAEGCLAEK
jgi:hypothetical protein